MPKKKVVSVAEAAQATIPEFKRLGVDLPFDLFLMFKQHCVKKDITITAEVERIIRAELGGKNG